jgi:hypothetical protein
MPTSSVDQPDSFSFSFHLLCFVCIGRENESILSSGTHRNEEKKKKKERVGEGEREREREKDSLTEEASDGGKSEFHLH